MKRFIVSWFVLVPLLTAPGVTLAQTAVKDSAPPAREDTTTADEAPVDLEALAAERKKKRDRSRVENRVSRYLGAAAKASEDGKPEEGLALLDKLRLPRLNPQERAYVYRLRGYLNYAAGNYDATIESFQAVLDEEIMAPDVDNRIRFNIAQLYATLQQWENVLTAFEQWFRYTEEPVPLAYYLLGISNFQLGDVPAAIENTEKAIDLAPEPQEGWLQLLAALYVQQEDYPNATPVLEELVRRFPKKAYWGQLSLIYGARDDYRHSLAVQQVAYLQGLLTEDKELRRLARSYLYHDLPYPAATVLERHIESGDIAQEASAFELLANSWIAAREYDRSLPALQKAAELSDDGKLLVRLGQVHLQREEWSEAAERLRQAIERGGLDKLGSAHLLLGIAYYNADRVASAQSAFFRARKHEAARAEAERWLGHIENETASETAQESAASSES